MYILTAEWALPQVGFCIAHGRRAVQLLLLRPLVLEPREETMIFFLNFFL